MKRKLIFSVVFVFFLIAALIAKNTIFFSENILGNLKFSFYSKNLYSLNLNNKIIGYIGSEEGWFISKNYAYGTILDNNLGNGYSYFLYNCKDDSYQIVKDRNQFQEILNIYHLDWKNFRDMAVVEEWSAVKENKRKFSPVCPKSFFQAA